MLKFEELQLKAEILQAVEDMGFEEATPIQELAIPIAITGKDVIGQAQTGTGKTAAFSIPLLEMIDEEEVVQALILTPTRELCIQVEKEIHKLCRYLNIRSVAVYGGQEIIRQIKALKAKPQIIVATPGRLLDHMERHTIKLQNLKFVVLDEADEMLNMGFLEDIEKILSACPEPRQMMMFSATMRKEIQEIANKFMHEPELVKVKATELTVPAIEQHYYEVMESKKFALLCRLLDIYHPELAMVFGRTKRRVDEVTEALQKLGYQAEGLHGDLTQRHRDMVMNKFRNGQISILVATDVAARGLDISGVTHVINFDLPQDIDSYVHRIGRTGRAGKEGLAMTFVEPREFPHLKSIETTIKRKIDKKKAPTFQDAQEKKQEQMYHAIRRVIEEEKYDGYRDMASDLLEQYDSLDLVAALLELTAGDDDHEQEIKKIKISAERPIMIKRVQSKKPSGKNSSKNTSRKENTGGFDKFRKDKQKPYYEAKAEANKKSKKSAKKDVKKDAKKDVKKDQKSNKKDKQKADNQ